MRLVGEGLIDGGQRDRRQLCELATVFFGLGVFVANAAVTIWHSNEAYEPHAAPRSGDWTTTQVGPLDEQLLGYALARYAVMRAEPNPDWAHGLDTNPRVYMKQAARYLSDLATTT